MWFDAGALRRWNVGNLDRYRVPWLENMAAEGAPGVLWTAIIVGGVLTMGFALLFGVSNERLHYLMVGGLAGTIALQIFVILILSFPFAGQVRVSPEPLHRVVVDFRH